MSETKASRRRKGPVKPAARSARAKKAPAVSGALPASEEAEAPSTVAQVTDEGGAPDTTPTERAIALFETLPPYAPVAGRYNQADRYRDFRKVLIEGGASVAEARRVLWQIFEETRLFHTPIGGAADTHATYARIGKQEIGRWLLTVLTAAPSDAGPVP